MVVDEEEDGGILMVEDNGCGEMMFLNEALLYLLGVTTHRVCIGLTSTLDSDWRTRSMDLFFPQIF